MAGDVLREFQFMCLPRRQEEYTGRCYFIAVIVDDMQSRSMRQEKNFIEIMPVWVGNLKVPVGIKHLNLVKNVFSGFFAEVVQAVYRDLTLG